MTCPKCGSEDVRHSQKPHSSDLIQGIGGKAAYRCRKCRERFFGTPSDSAGSKPRRKPLRTSSLAQKLNSKKANRIKRRITVVAVFLGVFLIFLLLLRYLTTERPTESSLLQTHWLHVPSSAGPAG
jgi:hypothetical protein